MTNLCMCDFVCVCVRARVPGGAPAPPMMRHGVTGGLVQETSKMVTTKKKMITDWIKFNMMLNEFDKNQHF